MSSQNAPGDVGGIGELLMRRVLTWASSAGLETLVLHASPEGQRLYERLGSVPTNEMRYAGSFLEAQFRNEGPPAGSA